MPSRKLTPSFVATATAEAGAERTIYWDETKPSFGLMVTESGHKSYVVQYRNGAGVSRRSTIDGFPSLADARKVATALLGEIAKGRDPMGERRVEKAAAKNTLRALAENYLKREGKNLRSADQMWA